MPQNQEVYTYRAGEKIILRKKSDQFVVRALPDELEKTMGITDAKQVSAESSRVTTRTTDLETSMSRSRNIAPTHHAYYVSNTNQEFLITDRIFVTFRESISPEEVGSFAGRYGLFMLKSYSARDYLFQLTDHTGMNPVKLVVKLTEQEPLVETADHALSHRMSKYQIDPPLNDSSYLRQWHLHTRLHDSEFDSRASSQCEEAWELLGSYGNAEVVIGITDDGCMLNHPDFDSPDKFAGWGYFEGARLITNQDIGADPNKMYTQGENHGTSCAGVSAAEVDAQLTVGAAPGCRLLSIKWPSDGEFLMIDDDFMWDVLNYLGDKVDVLSNSWGRSPERRWLPQIINKITDLAQNGGRRGKGIVFLWAAGNENCPIQHNASVEVPYTHGWKIRKKPLPPIWIGVKTATMFRHNLVDIPGVMHVAALASTAQRSHYSNYGTGISICAPSSNSHEYGRIPVKGQRLSITTTSGSTETDFNAVITNNFGGTSSATPLVAGIAALTISANPDLTALEVISILKQTASKDLNFEGYPRTPPAAFNSDTSWDVSPIAPFDKGDFKDVGDSDGTWSPWFGHGRVSASGAVAEALRLRER